MNKVEYINLENGRVIRVEHPDDGVPVSRKLPKSVKILLDSRDPKE